MAFPFRSPREKVGGLFVFGRILDKIRYYAKVGHLPEGYHLGIIPGTHTFDHRVCSFLGVSYEDLAHRTLEGGTDEEVLEWCFQHGRRPDQEQIDIWNAFLSKRGWRDESSTKVAEQKNALGLSHREDLQTIFDLMDAEERHGA